MDNYAYNFDPTLSQIMNSIAKNKLHIEMFEEYPHDISCLFSHLKNNEIKLPMSFILIARKNKGQGR
jgi:hypothetical protein